jgi:hypothetical protein
MRAEEDAMNSQSFSAWLPRKRTDKRAVNQCQHRPLLVRLAVLLREDRATVRPLALREIDEPRAAAPLAGCSVVRACNEKPSSATESCPSQDTDAARRPEHVPKGESPDVGVNDAGRTLADLRLTKRPSQ